MMMDKMCSGCINVTRAQSRNFWCHRIAISITNSECMSVALDIQHANCMSRITVSPVVCLVEPYFSTFS